MSSPPALFYLMAETQFVSETLCAVWSAELWTRFEKNTVIKNV
jgi:hypothetical protein